MAKLLGSSLFTGAISGLNSNYLLMLNGGTGLTLDNLLNLSSENVNYTVNQSFRSYMMNNFNQIDIDGDGTISQEDISGYTAKLQTQGMTYSELSQLCASNGSMSSLLDTVLSNFNEIDTNHDGRVTQNEINAYRINEEIKEVKEKYPKIDPTKMSMFYETNTSNDATSSTDTDDKVFK